MTQAPTIECKVNGPYLVKGLSDLRSSGAASLPTQPVIALCRCGGSAKKPFCDGAHQRNGFSGARPNAAAGGQRADYRAAGITIHDDRSLCAHAGQCTEGLASVFKYGSEPWIEPAGADIAAIVEVIKRCPSGALSYTLEPRQPPEPLPPPSVTVTKNGPYAVAGGCTLVDLGSGERIETTAACTLCRCGASKNKPFCDGSHWSVGFADDAPETGAQSV